VKRRLPVHMTEIGLAHQLLAVESVVLQTSGSPTLHIRRSGAWRGRSTLPTVEGSCAGGNCEKAAARAYD
jgi:hypothetical protein